MIFSCRAFLIDSERAEGGGVILTAAVLEGAGWELRCEHNIAIIFSCRAFLINFEVGRADGGGVGYPGESIIRKNSALTASGGKDDEDEFVSDMWTALPLLPSSSDVLVSSLLKALIVDFCICCWISLNERNDYIDTCGKRAESPNGLTCQEKKTPCVISLVVTLTPLLQYRNQIFCQNTNQTSKNRENNQRISTPNPN